MIADMSVDKGHKKLIIVVGFEAAQYSERYQVSIQSQALHDSKNVSKVNILNMSLILPVMTRIVVLGDLVCTTII